MSDSKYLSRADILNGDDRQYRDLAVPEWGEGRVVRLRSFSAKEVFAYQREIRELRAKKDGKEIAPEEVEQRGLGLLAVRSLVDADGARMFEDQDVEALLAKNSAALSRVATEALRLNKMRPQDVQELMGN